PGEVAPADTAERTVVIIDVLRASSSIVEAIASGARAIFPVGSIEEALRLANTLGRDEVLLCGERKCLPIEGFDLGNSPGEFTPERVAGKTLVMSTTNGTIAMALAPGASRVLIASSLNLTAVVDDLARSEGDPVLVCSGRERHFGLEDAVLAGEIAARLMKARPGDWELNDGAQAALRLARDFPLGEPLFSSTAAGRAITAAGLGEDLVFCAQVDRHSVVPVLQDRQIAPAPPLPAVPDR
ncbi:MAG TPA: 2-phosphosulfolactate phosphatase, partial [Longimicrobiaceae bacterium]|nr:2-phosphosulfolactate phosphatase [Longimicrobiaceae bacterium]